MRIRLRKTTKNDLAFVIDAEENKENSPYIAQWKLNEHENALKDPDILHLIVELPSNNEKVGFIILAGLKNKNKSLELMRIVITEKNNGYGSEAIEEIKKYALKELQFHRIWLDVKEFNARAKNVYIKCGFKIEGFLRECIFVDGHYESLYLLSILENEYCV